MPIILAVILIIGAFFVGKTNNSTISQSQQSTVTPTVAAQTPTPTLKPTVAPIPKVKGVTVPSTQKDDPIVNCVSYWQKSQGQTNNTKKSICDSWIDCQIGDKVIRSPKVTCDKYQGKVEELKKQASLTVNCQLTGGWVNMKKEDCINAQEEWRKQIGNEVAEELTKKFLDIEKRMWEAKTPDEFDTLQEELKKLQFP